MIERTRALSVGAFVAVIAAVAACDASRGTGGGEFVVTEVRVPAGEGSRYPFLATDSSGRTILTWAEREADSTAVIKFSERRPDGTWKDPLTLARDTGLLLNWADFAAVVPMDDGRLVGQWLRRGSQRGAYDLLLAQSVNGGEIWSAPVIPHGKVRPGEHGFVSMFSVPGGGAGVQFLDGTMTSDSSRAMALRHVVFDSTASIVHSEALDLRICDCCQTDAAMTSRGAVVVYRDRSDGEIRDISIVRRVDGKWTEPARVHADEWKIEGCPVNGPAVSALGDLVAVAWFSAARDTARVRLAFSSDAGATFGRPVELDSGATALGRVDVVMLGDGRAMVSWLHRASRETADVRVAVVGTGGRVEWMESLGETDAARPSGFPRMTESSGSVLLAWTETGGGTRVRAREVAIK